MIKFLETCVKKYGEVWGTIKAPNETENIGIVKEIPKERYRSLEK